MALSRVSTTGAMPITWAQVSAQVRQSLDDDLAFVETVIIPAVVERAEVATRRVLVESVWTLTLDGWPNEGFIEVPLPPLVSVTSVTYTDMAGTVQTWGASNYVVQAPAGPRCARGRLALPFASVWPIALPQMGAVTVRFRAGYVDESGDTPAGPSREVPPLLIQAMLMDAGTLYENRESIIADSGRATVMPMPGWTGQIYDSYRSYPRQRL